MVVNKQSLDPKFEWPLIFAEEMILDARDNREMEMLSHFDQDVRPKTELRDELFKNFSETFSCLRDHFTFPKSAKEAILKQIEETWGFFLDKLTEDLQSLQSEKIG
jgi:hypothetical protein